MNKKTVIDMTKLFLVEIAKGYVRAVALNLAALAMLLGIGLIWVKVDEFRKSHKK